MTTTLREFQRSFRRMRIAADSGREIVIRERNGAEYVFRATQPVARKTFGELAGHLAGSVKRAATDLSTNKKHLEGFGRD